jgi:hypothetical protein
MLGGWVFEQNLRPFLETIAALAGYDLDEDDLTAINYSLFKVSLADDQTATRVDYPLSGDRPMTVKLEHELGTSVVSYELTSDADPKHELTASRSSCRPTESASAPAAEPADAAPTLSRKLAIRQAARELGREEASIGITPLLDALGAPVATYT